MKWAILTMIVGYLVIWQIDQVQQYLLPVGGLLILIFSIYLTSKRIEVLPNIGHKIRVLFNLVVFSVTVTLALWYLIANNILPLWYYPPLFGLLVLSSRIIKWLINLTVREPKSFGVMSETERGETVRSKSEKKVADWLYENEYTYEYERKIELPDGNSILSDFYLPKYDIYIEYWGMASANNDAGEKYRVRKQEKKELYEQYDYKLMDIYPHHLYELANYIPNQIASLSGQSSGFFGWLKRLFGEKPQPDHPTKTFKAVDTTSDPDNSAETTTHIFCTGCGAEARRVGEFCVKCGSQIE